MVDGRPGLTPALIAARCEEARASIERARLTQQRAVAAVARATEIRRFSDRVAAWHGGPPPSGTAGDGVAARVDEMETVLNHLLSQVGHLLSENVALAQRLAGMQSLLPPEPPNPGEPISLHRRVRSRR